jgi:hypothetical protein
MEIVNLDVSHGGSCSHCFAATNTLATARNAGHGHHCIDARKNDFEMCLPGNAFLQCNMSIFAARLPESAFLQCIMSIFAARPLGWLATIASRALTWLLAYTWQDRTDA